MTKQEEIMKESCEVEGVSKKWLEKENTRLHEENFKMKIIIDLLLEELYRRPKKYD